MSDETRIDPELAALMERYGPKQPVLSMNALPRMRQLSRAAFGALSGRHAGTVEIVPREGGVEHRPSFVSKRNILYLHGGGWANGSTVSHGAVMTDLAGETGLTVVAPDYPLAPEAPYPAALDAVCALFRTLLAEAPGAAPVLAGDSAGANLALAAALRMRDEDAPMPSALVLFYGCYRRRFDSNSHARFGDGSFGLMTEAMRTYWSLYVGPHPDPVYADLDRCDPYGLPPVFIADAALDPLLDDGEWLARRLDTAGVPHERSVTPGVTHGVLHYTGLYDPAFRMISDAAAFLRRHGRTD